MKLKKLLFSLVIIMMACATADAQSILGRLANRAKNAAENAVGNKIENAVNGAIENAGKDKDKDNSKKNRKDKDSEPAEEATASYEEPAAPAAAAGWTCPECGKEGNTGKFCDDCGAKKPAEGTEAQAAAPAPKKKAPEMSWNNYDFVAGDEIIFEDTMENEQLGEFPSMWDLFEGNAEIAMIDGVKAINTQEGVITPLYNEGKPYLTDKCTVEMDLYMFNDETYRSLSGSGTGLNNYQIYLAKTDEISQIRYSGDCALWVEVDCSYYCDENGRSDMTVRYAWTTPGENSDVREGSYELKGVQCDQWHHIAISFNKRAFKVYFDEQRVANIPNAAAPKWLELQGSFDYERLYFWKNVRIAKGAVPLYDRLASEGRIVTYGITFDTGKATIKGESMGEINRIKELMVKDPSLKFEVQGHCDNTGSDKVNDKLSQERAEAIVARLVELGIAKDRLTAVGKGSKVPVADNSTDEGRAKNRRVEFIKK